MVTAADQPVDAQVVSLQLQQPGAAVATALQCVPDGALVVVDGAPEDDAARDAVPARADVVRADAAEARLLTGRHLSGVEDARDAPPTCSPPGRGWSRSRWAERATRSAGGRDRGSVWPPRSWRSTPRGPDGDVLVPLLGGPPVDPTGAGDVYVATLTATLLGGAAPEAAA